MGTVTMRIASPTLEVLHVHLFQFGTPTPLPNHQAVWLRMLADWLDRNPDLGYVWQVRFYPESDYDAEVMIMEPYSNPLGGRAEAVMLHDGGKCV